MKQGLTHRLFIHLLCISLTVLAGAFSVWVAEAKDPSRPIGELVARGDVKYQSVGMSWKSADLPRLPLFQGVRIKTEKGTSVIALANNSTLELDRNSAVLLEETDRLELTQGGIRFRIPATVDTRVKIAGLVITKYRPMQASKNIRVEPIKDEGITGALILHPNGSVTVKSEQGNLSITNAQRTVLASLTSKESITVPTAAAWGKEPMKVAQAGGETKVTTTGAAAGGEAALLGIGGLGLVGAGVTGAAIAGMIVVAETSDNGEETPAPVCR